MSYPIVIIEAGGTKTELLIKLASDTQPELFKLPGYNPNRDTQDFLEAFSKLEIPAKSTIHFYGAGLESDVNKDKTKSLFDGKNINQLEIYSDQLGAARAALGKNKGLIGILGTGAFVGYFDGQKIIARKGGYGYLIDDLGGGLELGKFILSKWLNYELSENLTLQIEKSLGCNRENFLPNFYQNPDFKKVAQIPQLLLEFGMENEQQEIATNYFSLFGNRHLHVLQQTYNVSDIHLVGSIAENFLPFIDTAFAQFGIKNIYLTLNQTQKLLEYHAEN